MPKNFRWNAAVPLGLLAFAIVAVLWIDLMTGGSANPPELLGVVGSPVRGTFVPSTPTPEGQEPRATATPRPDGAEPTVTGLPGTPLDRDGQRRGDLIFLFQALQGYKEENGSYITTGGKIQTLCAFKDLDQGCQLSEILGRDVPNDPAGDPLENGYWYRSDGETATLYAALEGPIPEDEVCDVDYVDFEDEQYMVCITAE